MVLTVNLSQKQTCPFYSLKEFLKGMLCAIMNPSRRWSVRLIG
jgi:hypothetical protein